MPAHDRNPITKFASELLCRQEEDLIIIGIQLTAQMAAFLSKKEAEHCFGVILRPLFETGPLRIKKELIACCAIVGKHVSEHFFSNDIVKHFLAERCKEPVMGVRKMCAEVMPHLVELTIT
jgi:hypothetical protein